MQALPLALVLVSVPSAGSGAAMLLRRRATVSASLLLLAGSAGVTAAVLLAGDSDRAGRLMATIAAAVLAPLTVATYPAARWRHPLDFVTLVVVGGCGVVSATYGTSDIIGLMGLVQGCALIAHTWWRIETATGRQRRALIWMSLAVTTTLLTYGVAVFSVEGSSGVAAGELAIVVFAVVGPAMYVGVTLTDLVDVRGLVVRVVVAVAGLVSVMSVFVLALSLLDAAGARDLNVGAQSLLVALSATVFHPTTVVLRGVVDQLLFGERPDPLGAASEVAGRIGEDPLPALRAIREALVVPYAALLVDGVPLVASGTDTTHTRTFDLDGAGALIVGLRPGDLAFSAGDEQVLGLTLPLLAQTLRARSLAEQLLDSRGHTITAVEEERRRLRRELHDGLGPRLTGVAFTADAAHNLIRTDPDQAAALLRQVRADTVTAIEEIRRMVYAMRPPALDDLGLVPALRQQATGLRNRGGQTISVDVSAPVDLPDLPAAVEVAAYRIVVEALTNVARHSDSSSARVRLEPGVGGLHIEVRDSGRGEAWRPGVGLSSMRERAAELGGTLAAGPGPDGGCVTAVLPL